MTTPVTPQPEKKKGGCLRNALIAGAGVLVLLCIIGVIANQGRTGTTITPGATQAPGVPTTAPAGDVAAAPTDTSAEEPTPVAMPLPTEEPAPTEAPALTVGAIGDRVVSGGIAMTINSAERVAQIGDFQKADDGNEFVLIDVTLENVDRDEAPYNPLYFKVKDADGYEYSAGITMTDNSLKSGDLAKGEKSRGTVSVEVPTGATGLVVSYEPIVIFGGYEVIRVALD